MGKNLFYLYRKSVSIVVVLLFVYIVGYLIYNGIIFFDRELISGTLMASLKGTAMLVALSVAIAAPLGIATGVYIDSYAKGWFRDFIDISFEVLAATPSIIIGLFGFSILLLLHTVFPEFRSSLLLAAVAVSFLILPYMVKATQLGMSETPVGYISTAYSLGAGKEDIIMRIKLPFASRHILKGLFLSIARAAEDTAVIMLTGVVASYGAPDGIFSPFEALPFYIYYTSANYESSAELSSIYVAIVMLMVISSLFMLLVGGSSKIISRGKLWSR